MTTVDKQVTPADAAPAQPSFNDDLSDSTARASIEGDIERRKHASSPNIGPGQVPITTEDDGQLHEDASGSGYRGQGGYGGLSDGAPANCHEPVEESAPGTSRNVAHEHKLEDR